jgi:hypothetical protein
MENYFYYEDENFCCPKVDGCLTYDKCDCVACGVNQMVLSHGNCGLLIENCLSYDFQTSDSSTCD